jgi:hypothetical protein
MAEPGPSLEERLARYETAEEARGLIAAYAGAIDVQDPEALRRIFAPEIVITAGEMVIRGRDEAVNFFVDYWSSYPATRRHFISNVAMMELAPSRAEATSYFLFVSTVEAAPMIGWGTYRDTFERQADGELRFSAKDMAVELDVDVRLGWADELARADGRDAMRVEKGRGAAT